MSTATANRPAATRPPTPPAKPSLRRGRRLLLVLLAVVLLLGVSGWLVYGSSVLSTKTVTVRGERQVTDGQVVEVAQVPIGRPLARQDVDAIARRATSLPAVRSATVDRDWPTSITITVVERQPLLGVRQPGGFVIVDRDGVAYENRSTLPSGAVIADVDPDAVDVLTQVGVVASALPKGLRTKVSTIKATGADEIELVLSSGLVIQWGASTDSPLKSEIVLALLKQDPKVSINVTSPHNPAIR